MSLTLLYRDQNDQLAVSDGTQAGTHELIVAGADPSGLAPFDITVLGGKFYFSGYDSSGNLGLWVSDGTAAGTTELPVFSGAPPLNPRSIILVGDKLFFVGELPGTDPIPAGLTLWVSDGTAAGTCAFDPASGPNPQNLTAFGSEAVFTESGQLWVTDGTEAGTHIFAPTADIYIDAPSFVTFDNKLLFAGHFPASDPYCMNSLVVTDGTAAGTHVLSLGDGAPGTFNPAPLLAWGNRAVFTATLFSGGTDLFATDGTTGGTFNISANLAAFRPVISSVVVQDGELLLNGIDAHGQTDLLLTDGTAAGTTIVQDPASTVLTPQSQNIGGTIYNFPNPAASLDPAATLYGDLRGRSVVNGTVNDDNITVYGASNVVQGNGGSDTITTGAGGYSQVIQGSLGDGAAGTTTIALEGRGNAVTGGDENFNIASGTGYTGITLGNGNETIALGGTYNTVTVGRGTNVIVAGGGYSKVFISGGFQGATPSDTVNFSGLHNQLVVDVFNDQFYAGGSITLTGGSGYGYYDLESMGGTVTTDGLYNTIIFSIPGAALTTVRPGSGYDTVNLGTPRQSPFYGPGAYDIDLSGTHNIVEGEGDPVIVTGGAGNGHFIFNAETNDGSTTIGGPVTGDRYTVTTGGGYNVFSLLDINSNTITAGSDHATVSIQDPALSYEPGQPLNTLFYAPSTISFAGAGNSLTAADGPVTATGGSGGSLYALGNGDDTITTGGSYNQITTGKGTDTISPGSDHATVTLNGSNAAVSLQGAADKVFLNAGAAGSISGTGLADLHVYVTPDIGKAIINGLLTDARPVIDLMGGAGGYTSASQVIAALTSDGHGGTQLAIGGGALDFAGVAPTALHAGVFVIG